MSVRPRLPPLILPEPVKLTYEDYAALPNDGKRYQLLDGRLEVTPAPTPRHQGASRNLLVALVLQLQNGEVGRVYDAPIDVVLGPHIVLQPDLLFIRKERLHIVGEAYIDGPPDLVVEVLSPSSRRTDMALKAALYARAGVPSYWLVDTDEERMDFYRLERDRYVLVLQASRPTVAEPEEFPGLRIDLEEVFGQP